jgi:FkbM family methyltransferase
MSKRTAILLLAMLSLTATAVAFEYKFGYITGYQPPGGYPMVRSPSLRLDLKERLHLQKFYSQLGQDKWILGKVFPDVADGYFVDVGAWDAEELSNSKALEERGWTGICVEPFPRNWKNRTCQLFKEVVYDRKGDVVRFRQSDVLGGIDQHINSHRAEVQRDPVVELTTTTLGDIFERANAPHFIHFVSIDTEGSELEILKGLPFDRYAVGAFAIEHNFEEPKRQQIKALLEAKGYRLERTQLVDDWFVKTSR